MLIDFGPIIAAPFIGSFLGVLVRRLPRKEAVGFARSHCEACGAVLGVRDLIPLLSFAAMRGYCRHCGGTISPFHLAIELAATGVALSAALICTQPELWFWCLLGWGLLALAWIDWEWMVLPDILTLPLLAAGLGLGIFYEPDSLILRTAGALVGWGSFAAIAWIYRRLRGRDGLGGGDAKLLAVAGAWLGLDMLPWVVVLAAVAAAIWTLALRFLRGQIMDNEPIAFGPWLALSIWVLGLLI